MKYSTHRAGFVASGQIAPSQKMKNIRPTVIRLLAPFGMVVGFLLIWSLLCHYSVCPPYQLPSPLDVGKSFQEEILSGRLVNNVIASVWRVLIGFSLAILLGIPIGLCLGNGLALRNALGPFLTFFRFLSPLSWIPFAIMWFHIEDKPAIFLIFMATFFSMALSVTAAVASIPSIYFQVARDYHYKGLTLLTRIALPAILPQVITALRMSYGIAWIVIVAAEMVGCQNGLGNGIWEARNSLRLDTAICYMISIGLLGTLQGRLLAQLTN